MMALLHHATVGARNEGPALRDKRAIDRAAAVLI
jgi:hypothetical protein